MRPVHSIFPFLVLLSSGIVNAASSWTFSDATVSLQGKGTGVGGGQKEALTPNEPLSESLTFDTGDKLKILLTTQDGKKAVRAHQTFLTLTDSATSLSESFPFTSKDNGKAKVELTHKDLPLQLLNTKNPLHAIITIASFGSSTPYKSAAFTLTIALDQAAPAVTQDPPIRYSALPEIHHIFRADPRSPPKIVTLVFFAAVAVSLPALFLGWAALGANANHLGKAMQAAPVSHAAFVGSIFALEGIFFAYYTSWTLFQMLPAAAAVGTVAFLSGSRALSEVQARRFAGLR